MPSGEDALDDGRKPQIHEAKHDRHDGNKAQNRKRRFARFLERKPRNLTQFAARIFDILRQAGDGVGGLFGLGVGLRGFLAVLETAALAVRATALRTVRGEGCSPLRKYCYLVSL